ncbi:MAG: hypothetical protein IT427_10515 [Pirellulales bacterium]|nr:hypothetical protein [Pirellulales bacterium]
MHGFVTKKKPSKSKPSRAAGTVQARRAGDSDWELVHPRCAKARAEDLAEVEQMIEVGENEIARDELLWLLQDCHDFVAGHAKLGELALLENDFKLARGHFGYAYQIGLKAIDASGRGNKFPYHQAGNRSLHEAGKGLVYCLVKLGKRGMARDVVKRLLELDPSDPLRVRDTLEEKTTPCSAPSPLVELPMPPAKAD